jgi:hypothetical protein
LGEAEAPSVQRDSLFGEPVVWSGRPKEVSTPAVYVAGATVCAITSAIAVAMAIVVSRVLGAPPGGLLGFAAWMATLAMAFGFGPRWWRSELEFLVTDKHIVMRRGRLRRSIEIKAISFARIHWDPKRADIGDLELVRAVPTGALRRRLSIVLSGLVAPDRVWAIMRGVTPSAPAGDGERLLAQRLDDGERVLWSAHPSAAWRAWLPTSFRAGGSVLIALALGASAVWTGMHAVHALRVVVKAGLDPASVAFVALAASLSLTLVLLVAAAIALLYATVVRPARLDKKTRYWITDRRVLIRRGHVELHLDRSRIADVIDAPTEGGLHDVFLVLDGPRARSFAASGAFGEKYDSGVQPVLQRIADVEPIQAILRSPAPFPRAA